MMIEELKHMKYLKIEDNRGFFLRIVDDESQTWIEINQICKEELFYL